jgi:hypothetical protein
MKAESRPSSEQGLASAVNPFFGDGIPRRLLMRVLPAKPPSAPLRF